VRTTEPDYGAEAFLGRVGSLVAHELRTPLAVIVGYAELLAQRDDARIRVEAAAQISRAAARLSRMIDDLLAAAALETGQVFVDAEPVELRAALQDASARMEAAGDTCRFEVIGASHPLVDVDPGHLRHMLTNVVTVACGSAAPVEASVEEEDGFAVMMLAPVSAPRADERAAGLAVSVAQGLSELAGGSLSLAADALTLRLPLTDAGGPA
jgi:K+-sensing histidine kinase KdpD